MTNRRSAFEQKPLRVQSGLMHFATQPEYNPSVPNVKNILMSKWHLIQNQPLLREIYREPPFISYRKGKYRKGKSLQDILVNYLYATRTREAVRLYELTSAMEFHEVDASLAKRVNHIKY